MHDRAGSVDQVANSMSHGNLVSGLTLVLSKGAAHASLIGVVHPDGEPRYDTISDSEPEGESTQEFPGVPTRTGSIVYGVHAATHTRHRRDVPISLLPDAEASLYGERREID